MANEVAVIIPFYKNQTQLDTCLAHLDHQTYPVRPYIHDNSEHNLYFTRAVNQALLTALKNHHDYYLILNQDMYLEPQAVDHMVRFMRSKPKCGITTALQLKQDAPDYAFDAGGAIAFPWGKSLAGMRNQLKKPYPVTWVSGACMFLKRDMIAEIGVLDSNLVFIGSDSDYCFTARSRGWDVWVEPRAAGIHETGSAKLTHNPTIEKIKLEDIRYFAKKWLSSALYHTLCDRRERHSSAEVSAILKQIEEHLVGMSTGSP